jgi:hypothetical protein
MTKLPIRLLLCGVVVGLVGARALHARQDVPHPETQKLIMENTFVRVFDIRVPAGVFEPMHSHARGLTIALTDYENETRTNANGAFNRGRSKFGDVRWAEPVTHEARNIGTTEQHVIRIELK